MPPMAWIPPAIASASLSGKSLTHATTSDMKKRGAVLPGLGQLVFGKGVDDPSRLDDGYEGIVASVVVGKVVSGGDDMGDALKLEIGVGVLVDDDFSIV